MTKIRVLSMLVFACGFCLGNVFQPWSAVHAQSNTRVFEIRTYTAAEGKLDALHARFRDHTLALFKKHDMTSVGYFKPIPGRHEFGDVAERMPRPEGHPWP